jgi:hypothetical protein
LGFSITIHHGYGAGLAELDLNDVLPGSHPEGHGECVREIAHVAVPNGAGRSNWVRRVASVWRRSSAEIASNDLRCSLRVNIANVSKRVVNHRSKLRVEPKHSVLWRYETANLDDRCFELIGHGVDEYVTTCVHGVLLCAGVPDVLGNRCRRAQHEHGGT